MRALVEEIDSHAELIHLEIASNPTTEQDQAPQSLLPSPKLQTAVDASSHPSEQLQDPIV